MNRSLYIQEFKVHLKGNFVLHSLLIIYRQNGVYGSLPFVISQAVAITPFLMLQAIAMAIPVGYSDF